jgi:hypothetical protein
MSTFNFKKDTNGFSITKNGAFEAFSGEPVRCKVVNDALIIVISGQTYAEVKATDTTVVNDAPFSSTMLALGQKLKDEVFFLAKNTATAANVTLPAGTASYNLPAGTNIRKVIVLEPNTITFKLGTTVGGRELGTVITSDGFATLTISTYFKTATTLYFSGVTPNSIIKIFI